MLRVIDFNSEVLHNHLLQEKTRSSRMRPNSPAVILSLPRLENSGTHGGSFSISDNVWSSFGAGGNEFEEELRQELERQGQLEGDPDHVREQDSDSAES